MVVKKSRITGSTLKGECHRLSYLANSVSKSVTEKLIRSPLSDIAYTIKSRVKTPGRIENKIIEKRNGAKRGDEYWAYDHTDITDSFGLRIVTLFQNDIPAVVETVIKMVEQDPCFVEFPFVKNSLQEVNVYTSRPLSDPYSISSDVEEIVKRAGYASKLIPPKNRRSGYSSVHLIVEVEARPEHDGAIIRLPIELQVRDIFEEAWGEIDHRLRYKPDGSRLNDENPLISSWLAHLNSLKTICDGCSQQAWIIKDRPLSNAERAEDVGESRHVETTQEAIDWLVKSLPANLHNKIHEAYDLRVRADLGTDRGVREELFSQTERAFSDIEVAAANLLNEKIQNGKTVGYLLRLERAFCQYAGGAPLDIDKAVSSYKSLSEEFPGDPVTLYRLGTALIYKSEVEKNKSVAKEAISTLIQAQKHLKSDNSLSSVHWICSAIPRNIGYAWWLCYDFSNVDKKSIDYLVESISFTKKAVSASRKVRGVGELRKSLNNMTYYMWVYLSSGGKETKGTLDRKTLSKYTNDLMKCVDIFSSSNIYVLETMASVLKYLGRNEEAKRVANQGIAVLHERALKRSGKPRIEMITTIKDYLRPEEIEIMQSFAMQLLGSLGLSDLMLNGGR